MMDLKIKIKLKIFLFVFISCVLFTGVLPGSASAQETEVSETIKYIELKINENGIVDVTQDMELEAHATVYRADAIIPKAKNAVVYDSTLDRMLEHGSVSINDEELINFYFPDPVSAGEKRNITINYSTEFFTNKRGDTWELSFLLSIPNNTIIKAVFPGNAVISLTSSEIIPSTYIENGMPVLELQSTGNEIDFLCEYRFMEKQEDVNETGNRAKENETGSKNRVNLTGNQTIIKPGDKRFNNPAFTLILILIIFLASGALYYLKFKKPCTPLEKQKGEIKETKKNGKINSSIARLLDENERTVVELLQSKGKETTQAEIRKSTKIPGSTLSKVMLRLEERNIIERRGEGKTKRVKLKEWIFE